MIQLLLEGVPFAHSNRTLWYLGLLILASTAALILDRLLGEPSRFHPLVGFGNITRILEQRLNQGTEVQKRIRGAVAWGLLVLPITLVFALAMHWVLIWSDFWFYVFSAFILYITIGMKSLEQHASWVAAPLKEGNIEQAREKVSWLVSRDTASMDETDICKACMESVLENGNDAVFGALFWFLIAGAPGAVLYRLVNTLDACWGYRNEKYRHFGWWSARADDWLNLAPARICALCYTLCGSSKNALNSWRSINRWRKTDGVGFASPNAGIVMASGAGALRLCLGGDAVYDDQLVRKPPLGIGQPPEIKDIGRSVTLLKRAVNLFMIMVIVLFGIFSFFPQSTPF